MVISYNWLQNYFEKKLPSPEEISEGIIFHSFEIESIEKVGEDNIFDIKILPDRAHDCLSHWGIAKEISAIFNLLIKKVEISEKENLPISDLKIEIRDKKCRRYIGQVVKNLKVGESPKWLKEKLEAIGQRSINNIVDATNYVMFDLGNPIHAFDLDKLSGHKIIVENAKDGEKIALLDGKEVELDSSILTIRDEKEALAIAGIKGGKKAEIDENTKNIVIEVANFDPTTVRKTSKRLGVFTDSAKRFENEISPKLAEIAIQKISDLIIKTAGGEKYQSIDTNNKEEKEKTISFNISYLNKLLGLDLKEGDINKILDRLNYDYKCQDERYEVIVPFLRLDITGAHDMAEEIGRIYGYDKIVPKLPEINSRGEDDLIWQKINLTKIKLINDGYREVMTYVFGDKGEVEVLASASDKKFLRTNLSDGLKESVRLNKINLPLLDIDEACTDGTGGVKVFEIGTVFLRDKEEIHVAYGDEKNITEMTLEEFAKGGVSFSDELLSTFNFQLSTNFKPWSVYPFITRDIAVWIPSEVESSKVFQVIKENAGELLVRDPKLFDEFTKGDKISYAFRLVFQSYEKTLTDDEVNKIMQKIEEKIKENNWEVR